ncbi:MAG: ribosome biogenesis GTPase YlqF [Candidatus Obscuribacterales bacterium]|nr:ribosome biogenesis GTPase YlqF [Candidatus Obscuribacterales bacterium]
MPFHKKAGTTPLQRLKEQLDAVDVLFEVRDARLPDSSIHPKTMEFFGKKPRVVVFTKEDLADPVSIRAWVRALSGAQQKAITLSLKQSRGKDHLISLAAELCKDKIEARKRKGLLPRPIRVAVVGLPNVGKSSLINWLIGKKKAAVANTPGVTRSNSWIRIDPQVELLDTPGMLPSAAFKGSQAMKLAMCNILPGEHYDIEEIASFGLELISRIYPENLEKFRKDGRSGDNLESVAHARACLKAGAEPDLKRAAAVFLSEFRSAKLGRMVLDKDMPSVALPDSGKGQNPDPGDPDL